jgi:DNA-binding transcriptional LysR family regulator
VIAKSGRKPQQSAGIFALQRPGKFRWSYEKPYKQLLVSDGNKLWSYDPDLNQSQWLLKELSKRGKTFARTLTSSNLEVVAALVAEGCGAGILPERVARRAGEKIARYDRSLPSFQDRLCLIYRADSPRTKASQAIVAAIRAAKI